MSVQKKRSSKHIGPGGINCPCCAPAPGKERKAFMRSAKRSERQEWKRDVANDMKQEEVK